MVHFPLWGRWCYIPRVDKREGEYRTVVYAYGEHCWESNMTFKVVHVRIADSAIIVNAKKGANTYW